MIIPVVITVYSDRSFTFIMKTPPASVLLKKAAGLATTKKPGSGSKEPNKNKVGKVITEAARGAGSAQDAGHEHHQPRGGHRAAWPAPRGRWASKSASDPGTSGAPRSDLHRQFLAVATRRDRESSPRYDGRAVGGASRNSKEGKCLKSPRNRKRLGSKSTAAKKHTARRGVCAREEGGSAKFDETVDLAVRLGVNPRHADQMVRGAVVLPHGTGQALRVLVFAKGEKAKEAEAERRRLRRRRGPRGQGPGRLHGLRPRHRHARHDGPGRQARAHPRPARPHAEPQGRHGHVRREDGRVRGQGRQGRVPRREGGHRPRPHRQGLVHREGALRQRGRAHPGAGAGQAGDGQGHLPAQHHALARPWAPACASTRCTSAAPRPRRPDHGTSAERDGRQGASPRSSIA